MERRTPRIGELLSRLVPLSDHDVEEILNEQAATRMRFGEIALAWGLCQPQHVWMAWAKQLANGSHRVDLHEVGVDGQAPGILSAERARQLRAIPIRLGEDWAIVAIDRPANEHTIEQLSQSLGRRVTCVVAEDGQIEHFLTRIYPIEQLLN